MGVDGINGFDLDEAPADVAEERALSSKKGKRKNAGSRRARVSVQSPLETYLHEINEVSLLSADKEKELGVRIQSGDTEARDEMIRANLRLVVNIARSYTGKGLGLQDLIEEGNIGLMRAVEGFDPRMNTRFSTYASYWIKQAIKRALVNTAKTIRIPAYMVELLAKWRRAGAQLQEMNGRPPTHDEIAKALNLNPRKYAIVKKALKVYGAAMNTDSTQRSDQALSIDEMIADENAQTPEVILGNAQDLAKMYELLDKMDPREANVLRMRFGLIKNEEPKTLKEIGESLGLTRERVRQIEAEALAKLSNAMHREEEKCTKSAGVSRTVRAGRLKLFDLMYARFPGKRFGIDNAKLSEQMGIVNGQMTECRSWLGDLFKKDSRHYQPLSGFIAKLAAVLQLHEDELKAMLQ